MTFRNTASAAPDRMAPVSRREFLTLSTSGTERVLELSCEPFFMRYADAQSSVGIRGGRGDIAEPAIGEPSTHIELPTAQSLFAELEAKLLDADVLRVIGREWLTGGELGKRVAACIESFTAAGGRVEYRESQ